MEVRRLEADIPQLIAGEVALEILMIFHRAMVGAILLVPILVLLDFFEVAAAVRAIG